MSPMTIGGRLGSITKYNRGLDSIFRQSMPSSGVMTPRRRSGSGQISITGK
jgi:hypothetical protein